MAPSFIKQRITLKILHFTFYILHLHRYKPGYRFLLKWEEESPDSIGQCTGEQPGVPL